MILFGGSFSGGYASPSGLVAVGFAGLDFV